MPGVVLAGSLLLLAAFFKSGSQPFRGFELLNTLTSSSQGIENTNLQFLGFSSIGQIFIAMTNLIDPSVTVTQSLSKKPEELGSCYTKNVVLYG